MNYYSKEGQSVYDICLQVYGTLDKLTKLLQDSNFPNVNTYPVSGTLFIFTPNLTSDYQFAQWLNNNKITLNTGDPPFGDIVFSSEDESEIFVSEDETIEFTPET